MLLPAWRSNSEQPTAWQGGGEGGEGRGRGRKGADEEDNKG